MDTFNNLDLEQILMDASDSEGDDFVRANAPMEDLLVARHPYSGCTNNLQLEELLREEEDGVDEEEEQLSRRFNHLEQILRDDDNLYLQQILRGDNYDDHRRSRPLGRSQTSTLSTQEITGMASMPPTDLSSPNADLLQSCTYGDPPITAKPPPTTIHQSFQRSMSNFSSLGGNMPKFQFPAIGKTNKSESSCKTPPLSLFLPSDPTSYSGPPAPVNSDNSEEKRRLLSMPTLGLTGSSGASDNDDKTEETTTSPFAKLWPPGMMSQNNILEEIRFRREAAAAAAAASTTREQAPRSSSGKQQQSSSGNNPPWPALAIADSIRNLDANANAAVSDLVSRLDGTKQEEIQRRQSRKPRADMDVPLSSKATTNLRRKSSKGKKKKNSSSKKRESAAATTKDKSGTS